MEARVIKWLYAEDVAEILQISKSHAYKVIRRMNKELSAQGIFTIQGRIDSKYFYEKTCYGSKEEKA